MTIQVHGKCYRKGVGKATGKPYEFTEIHYLARKRGVDGLAAITKTIDPAVIAYDRIEINGEYNIEYDDAGNIIEMSAVNVKTNQGTVSTTQK